MSVLLQAAGIHAYYGDSHILRGVDLTLARGEAVGLLGRNGMGKTTLIRTLMGYVRARQGRVQWQGAEVTNQPPEKMSRRGIGYVFQEGRLFPHMNVRANLDYGRWMSGRKRHKAVFERVVELLGIGHLLARRPGGLSGGERQRIAIGRALLMQPRLLLLDEPLASLDSDRKAEIFPYLERLRDEAGVPMIYVSHSPEEIRRIATVVVLLDNGRVARIGGTEILGASHSEFA
ncbi:MAG: molybdenum ABC transporter ATP-binding protein [Alphaproteobacteria bacterium]|nr:molybdenum ABC transporter ATP-binding protein [Alphaproteobacteria bacterium]